MKRNLKKSILTNPYNISLYGYALRAYGLNMQFHSFRCNKAHFLWPDDGSELKAEVINETEKEVTLKLI